MTAAAAQRRYCNILARGRFGFNLATAAPPHGSHHLAR